MSSAASKKVPNEGSPQAVLLVEDDVLIRLALAAELRSGGLTVVEAACAAEALNIFESGMGIGAVFTDIFMPGELDGVGLARVIRNRFPIIPCILTSGNRLPPNAPSDCLFVAKPYDPRHVLRLLNAALRKAVP